MSAHSAPSPLRELVVPFLEDLDAWRLASTGAEEPNCLVCPSWDRHELLSAPREHNWVRSARKTRSPTAFPTADGAGFKRPACAPARRVLRLAEATGSSATTLEPAAEPHLPSVSSPFSTFSPHPSKRSGGRPGALRPPVPLSGRPGTSSRFRLVH
jgi:hypothetical protein